MKYYIKERHNPQLDKPYYVAEGKLTKKDACKKEKSLYGHNNMLEYETIEDYQKALNEFEEKGFNVHNH